MFPEYQGWPTAGIGKFSETLEVVERYFQLAALGPNLDALASTMRPRMRLAYALDDFVQMIRSAARGPEPWQADLRKVIAAYPDLPSMVDDEEPPEEEVPTPESLTAERFIEPESN